MHIDLLDLATLAVCATSRPPLLYSGTPSSRACRTPQSTGVAPTSALHTTSTQQEPFPVVKRLVVLGRAVSATATMDELCNAQAPCLRPQGA